LSIAASAALRAQIAAKEIQLSAMRTFATDSNPDMRRALQELAGLRKELAKIEKDSPSGKGDALVTFGKAPEVGLEYVRKYREMKYYETLYEVLAKQYEIARIDESKDATLIQVLDSAVVPERKSRPKRVLIVLVTVFISGFVAAAWALARNAIEDARKKPAGARQLGALKQLLWGRSSSSAP
jgi:uncharacterized protein involved in exopolysaccharide biosynthesis